MFVFYFIQGKFYEMKRHCMSIYVFFSYKYYRVIDIFLQEKREEYINQLTDNLGLYIE